MCILDIFSTTLSATWRCVLIAILFTEIIGVDILEPDTIQSSTMAMDNFPFISIYQFTGGFLIFGL